MAWLSEKLVEELTRRKQPKAQMRVLAMAGIPFREVDGRPIVVDKDLSAIENQVKRVKRL